MAYRQITDQDSNGFYLDLDIKDGYLMVWNSDDGNGELGLYGEWPAREVYKELKAYFEGDLNDL